MELPTPIRIKPRDNVDGVVGVHDGLNKAGILGNRCGYSSGGILEKRFWIRYT
jgi:hypothetical protein